MKKELFTFNLKDITEIGILTALAVVFDLFVKIPTAIAGGSVGIAMIPLIIIAVHKGWFKGFIAGGVIFGLITCLTDGYGFATFPFDYFFAFGGVAVVGLFKDLVITEKETAMNSVWFAVGIIACFAIRFVSSTISGMIVYGATFVESVVYQLSYIPGTLLIDGILLLAMLPALLPVFRRLG